MRTIAFQWSFRLKDSYKLNLIDRFEQWLKTYITSWSSCDDFSTHSLGYLIYNFPQLADKCKEWAKSDQLWVQRGASVSLIYGLRRNKFLEDAFEIANILMDVDEMYVQKGFGWMLKEAANNYQKEVYKFVLENKHQMPRVSLRYAIEKMPEEMREKAMN